MPPIWLNMTIAVLRDDDSFTFPVRPPLPASFPVALEDAGVNVVVFPLELICAV